MTINYEDAIALAKSLTEICVQKGFLSLNQSVEDFAKEIATFHNTLLDEVIKHTIDE